MVDDNETKKSRKIKATTGAWWKSTVVEEEPEKKAESTVQDKTVEKTTPAKPAPAKPAPRKRAPRKKTPAPKAVDTVEAPAAETTGEAAPPKKKRAPRKKSAPKASAESPEQLDVSGEPAEASDQTTTAGATAKSEATTAKPKRTRRAAPKKRAPAKKAEAASGEEVTTTDEQPATTPEDVAATEGEPVKEAPKRARSGRGRTTRGRKPAQKKASETGEIAEAPVKDAPKEEQAAAADEAVQTEQEVVEEPKRKRAPRKPRARKKPEANVEKDKVEAESENDVQSAATESDLVADDLIHQADEPVVEADVEDLPEEKEVAEKDKVVLKLLINAEEPEECRLALLENGRLESIHVSTITRAQTKNNIYKGRIVAIEPNLQAAFVDYGTDKNGFLPFSEIHPEYYKQELGDDIQKLVDAHHWKKLSITDVVDKGQDVLVQVVKEEIGKKGANMTTYLSLPGRSVVLMPGSDSSGISRKISGEERRSQLRKAMNSQDIPEGIGWIVRTASADITKTALTRDVGYLLRLWEEIKKKAQGLSGVGQVYEDHQSVLRFLREHFDPQIEEIQVDDKDALDQVKEFISLLPSKQRDVNVRLHKGSRPIFNQYSIEDQIESIYQPKVNLPSGGSIVIDPTEALVAIDVNSGSTSKGKNFEQSIFQANLEAASELARQLRLRDLGGLIVVDFIDMRNKKHIRDVERQVKQAMKRDKAKVDFSRISKFGLMQISRQKLGAPIEAGNYRVCEHCKGRGTVRSIETLALFYLRRIQTGASRKHVEKVECHFPLDVAQYLLNKKRHEIQEHESRYNTEILIIPEPGMTPVENEIFLLKAEKETNGKKQA